MSPSTVSGYQICTWQCLSAPSPGGREDPVKPRRCPRHGEARTMAPGCHSPASCTGAAVGASFFKYQLYAQRFAASKCRLHYNLGEQVRGSVRTAPIRRPRRPPDFTPAHNRTGPRPCTASGLPRSDAASPLAPCPLQSRPESQGTLRQE